MKTRAIVTLLIVGIIVAWGATTPAFGGDRLAELRESFKNRYDELLKLKGEGKIGETWDGYVEAVKKEYLSEKRVRTVIDEENRDRRELYTLLAAQQNVPPEAVAQRNAARVAEKALPGHYLKEKDGTWRRVQEKK